VHTTGSNFQGDTVLEFLKDTPESVYLSLASLTLPFLHARI
jgi:hypothetical protein